MLRIGPLALLVTLSACDPFGTGFDDREQAVLYASKTLEAPPNDPDELRVMTWNVKFGAGRVDFFFDCHGERGMLTEAEVTTHLSGLAAKIREIDPDIVVLNEIEIGSRRSSYVDQVQHLLDNTALNHGAYAAVWRVDFVPSDGIGRMDMGNAILARWPLRDAERIALPLISEHDGLTQYFYLKRNLLRARVDLPSGRDPWVVATHTAAFSQDGTKRRHIERFKAEIDALSEDGSLVIGAGDLNALPPGSDKVRDFPDSACDERFEADDYSEETDWLAELYDAYSPAIPLDVYQGDNEPHFTHTTDGGGFWNRKLDYLFANVGLTDGRTHQDTMALSDHAPVSATLPRRITTP